MRDQLNKMSSVGSDEQKRKLMGDIDAKTKSFNRQVEDAQAELDQEQGRVLNELGSRMLAVLEVRQRQWLCGDPGCQARSKRRCCLRRRVSTSRGRWSIFITRTRLLLRHLPAAPQQHRAAPAATRPSSHQQQSLPQR